MRLKHEYMIPLWASISTKIGKCTWFIT